MQGIFQKENTDKALKYGIYRHLPTYEKIIRNLVSFLDKNKRLFADGRKLIDDHTLVALTIMIAESRPDEMEMMVTVILNCLK